MYQYSLEWFINLFIQVCKDAPDPGNLDGRLQSLIDTFTLQLYRTVTRSLFEEHKLMLSLLFAVRHNYITP